MLTTVAEYVAIRVGTGACRVVGRNLGVQNCRQIRTRTEQSIRRHLCKEYVYFSIITTSVTKSRTYLASSPAA